MKPKKKRPLLPPSPMAAFAEIDDLEANEPAPMVDGMFSTMIEMDDPIYRERHAMAQELQLHTAEEGFILLKNEGALPLSQRRINLFGRKANIYFDPSVCARYNLAINEELFDYFQTYKTQDAAYTGSGWDEAAGTYVSQSRAPTGMFGDMGYVLPEPFIGHDVLNEDGTVRIVRITEQLLDQAKAFSDTGAVVLYRQAGEGADHEKGDEELTEGEASMLSFCSQNFRHVIVILATNNVIDGEFLVKDTEYAFYQYTYGGGVYSNNVGNEILADFASRVELRYVDEVGAPAPHRYPIDASRITGCIYTCDKPGDRGSEALVRILTGEVNPSGRLTDEIVSDFDDNPVSLNCGGMAFSRASTTDDLYAYGHNYVAYKEGVYLGYKYFETFQPDRVVFPFGFGLSYTDFSWQAGPLKTGVNDYGEPQFVVDVTVSNIGDKAGKDVVELYVTAPYYEKGAFHLEKPLVSLAAYEKTGLLTPGATETLTLRWNARDIACYSDTAQCYMLEGGEYRFCVASNANTAHNAPSSILIWTLDKDAAAGFCTRDGYIRAEEDSVFFTADEVTGSPYRNLFTGSEEEGYAFDAQGTKAEDVVYIHRVDVAGIPTVAEGTYPQNVIVDEITRETTQILDLETRGLDSYYEMDATKPYFYDSDIPVLTTNAVYRDLEGNLRNFMLQDVYRFLKDIESPYYHNLTAVKTQTGIDASTWTDEIDDLIWDRFLDQLSVNEMLTRFYHSGFELPSLMEYGVPTTYAADGPGQIGANNKMPMGRTTTYCDLILACTWNKDLIYRFGLALGRETATSGINGTSYFYAPGSNTHRTCLGGKSNNYFSEDAFLAGTSCGYFLRGLEEGGVNGCLKHFACNDQEISREGLVVFCNEQTLHQQYFAAFEHAIKIGGGQGIMTSLGRIGTVSACGNGHLTVDLLRKEWGFDGMVITDGYGVTAYMYDINCMLGGRSGLLCFGMAGNFGECLDFMELYRYYLQYPGRTTAALRCYMKGCMKSLLQSHTFRDLYTDFDYYSSLDADFTTDVNWFDAEIGAGYAYRQASALTYKGVKLNEGETNTGGGPFGPNTNSKDRCGTIATDDYGLTQLELTAKSGEVLNIPVSIQKSYGMSAFSFTLRFDTSVLTAEDVEFTDSILSQTYSCLMESTDRGLNISFTSRGDVFSVPCGTLFTLKLRIANSANPGAYELWLLPLEGPDGQPIDSFYDKQGHDMNWSVTRQTNKYNYGSSSFSGVYQSVEDASWWTNQMDTAVDDLADLTLLSSLIHVVD